MIRLEGHIHKIGILSDTHGLLREEVLESLKECEVIFHGGDINKQEILEQLKKIAPVYVVRGNNDKEWAENLPEMIIEKVFGISIFMIHNKKYIPKNLSNVDVVIYGHSHKYEVRTEEQVIYVNPGSCGPRRFHQEITLAILWVDEKGVNKMEKVLIPHTIKKEQKDPANLVEILPLVMRDINAGKTVKQLARKYHITEELSEQINRMYLTHPGVNVEGILKRLE